MAISLIRRVMTSLEDTTISRIFITGSHHPTKSNHVKLLPLTGREKRVIAKSHESITINLHSTQENSSESSVISVVADPKNHIVSKPLQATTTNSLSRKTSTKLKINHVNLVNPVSLPLSEKILKSYLTLERGVHPTLLEELSNLEAVIEEALVVTHVVG
jgi:pyruvate kinase